MSAVIPDSIDLLNLNGIMPYDIKTFIREGKEVSLAPQKDVLKMMSGVDSQDELILSNDNKNIKPTKKSHKFNPKLGILGASLVFLVYVILKKKCPKIGEFASKISTNIAKIFKK